jgi:histidyl-tRNA synthetase
MTNTNPARGMRDFLPSDVRKREYVIGIIKEVYESYGFEPLETPAVENIETLTGKYGEEGNQLIYKILKRGEKLEAGAAEKDLSDLALRYDLTVPLARVVANHRNELPKFFKRYQIQPVWRADRPAKGRYREFYQCDVDAIGSDSMVVEAEQISAVSEILKRLGFDDFVIRINHRQLLSTILSLMIADEGKHNDVLIALDKLDKIGADGVYEELVQRGINQSDAHDTIALFRKLDQHRRTATSNAATNTFVLEAAEEILSKDERSLFGLEALKTILDLSRNTHVVVDPSLARGLSYYTGAIMEINVPQLAGSLGGGGRYDGLIGMFGKEQIPACGFSLGLERIIVVMEEMGTFQKLADEGKLKIDSADVMVTIWNEESIAESLKLANELRAQNLRVLVYPEADKLGKQFKYAGQINVPYVCVIGESELADNKVTVKNMTTGEQETVARAVAAEKIAGK